MRFRSLTGAFWIAFFTMTCCAQMPSPTDGAGTEQSQSPMQAPGIKIGPGDQIDMTVFNVPEMTERQRVDENGNYAVPLVGAVQIGGMTVQQAQALIAAKLEEKNFLRSPSVSLFISDFATQGVSVMGEVMKPGVYPVWGQRHLFDLIAEAGGVGPRAGRFATITHRDDAGASQYYEFSNGKAEDPRANPLVSPGDTIVIARTGLVYVLGEVGRPGGFPLDNQAGLSLLQAIALAEGTTRTAKVGSARLIRKEGETRKEIPINLKNVFKGKADDIRLKDDDIVYVPNSVAKTVADRTLPQIVAATTTAAVYTGLR